MSTRAKIRNAALVGALAAVAATAWATNESTSAAAPESVAVSESLMPNETIVATSAPAAVPVAVPVVNKNVSQPAITIEERRLSEDERIQAAVMDKLASNSRLSGKIGVESNNAVVRLSGYTSTVGQATRAGNDARSVFGVRYVQNEIRPRVGGSV